MGRRTVAICWMLLSAMLAMRTSAQIVATGGPADGVLTLNSLGQGTAELGGKWQFHLGDDPRWSDPALEDAGWEKVTAEAPWGAQGHPSYNGFAWYRRRIDIRPAPGVTVQYALLIPDCQDAYEVFWNGKEIGQYGHFPPHPSWYYSVFPRTFPLTGETSGVLAIRVWKAPLDIFSIAESGGLNQVPVVGDLDTVTLYERAITWSNVRSDLFDYSLVLLRTFIATLCVFLWSRNRREQIFLWTGIFTLTPVALSILQNLFFIPFSYDLARFINQPVYALSNIALWFLLLWLLQLNKRRALLRATRSLALLTLALGFLDGLLALVWGKAGHAMQWADGLLTGLMIFAELLPFVLIALALRNSLDVSRWVVAGAALVSQMFQTFADASAVGRRFTHWTLYDRLIDNHELQIQGVLFSPQKISSLVLFAAILYAVYHYILVQQARRTVLEQEMQSAREIQRVLIPETLPSLEGYSITSAYTPAQEVGGDFFQIVSNPDGSSIVVIGDVSGKGLKAAMNVSMILGVVRAVAANTSSPAEILNALNQCLAGRMQGGFATGIVFRLDSDGTVVFANAGHLPPYLNGKEFFLDPSLPVGLSDQAEYVESSVGLHPGDQLSFYTDGLLEARASDGELYGFERLQTLFSARPSAQQACAAAVAFGQDDDITVLTLTKLAAGERSETLVVVPNLEEAEALV